MSELFYFEKMPVWKISRQLVNRIYEITATFPASEKYNLSDQLRRAATSIASNIAESSGRVAVNDRKRFIDFAYGSLMEVRGQLLLALDQQYITDETLTSISEDIATIYRMLIGMRKHLQESQPNNTLPT